MITVLVISFAAPAGAVFAQEVQAITDEAVELESVLDEEPEEQGLGIEEVEAEKEQEVDDAPQPELLPPRDVAPEFGLPEERDNSDHISENNPQPPVTYPKIVISELQVDGKCDGGAWCTKKDDNVEFIELYNPNKFDVSLDGWRLQTVATGETSQPSDYVKFEKIGLFAGEYAVIARGVTGEMLLPLPSRTLSNEAGSLILLAPDGSEVDMVGWGAKSKRYHTLPAVAPAANQSIQRCIKDGSLLERNPRSNAEELLVYADLGPTPRAGIMCAEPPIVNLCQGVILSEIGPNVQSQFIELHNPTDRPVSLAGCRLQTNNNKKSFMFADERVIGIGEYLTVPIEGTDLTLTKTTIGTVYFLSSDGLIEIDSIEYRNLAKETSWSFIEGTWRQTYTVTPGAANVYQRYLPCEEGYWRNEDTGRCNKVVEPKGETDCGEGRERNPLSGRCRNTPTENELAPCREGQYRSEETNRCRSIATAAASVLKPCADDQFRNPATNRCKKIASSDDAMLADCGEGRERNPATNRCRNVTSSTPPAAGFAVEPIADAVNVFVGWWVLGGLALVAVGYAGWEWREEILKVIRKIGTITSSKK